MNFRLPARSGAGAPQAVAASSHVSDALPGAPRSRTLALEATTDKLKTKQNAHRFPKTARPAPTGRAVGSCPTCPLHLQPRPRAAGLRGPSPSRPPPPGAAETARRGSPGLGGRAPRGRRGAALTPEVLEEKQQQQDSARAVGEQLPKNLSPSLRNFSARFDVHFLNYFFFFFLTPSGPKRAPSLSRSNSHWSARTLIPFPRPVPGKPTAYLNHFSPAPCTRCPRTLRFQAKQTCNAASSSAPPRSQG